MTNVRTQALLSRRQAVAALAGGGLLLIAGGSVLAAPARRTLSAADKKLTMHRNPGCGCCTKWAEAARKAGFSVTVVDDPDIHALKAKLGVPDRLVSCHTTIVGPYAIEGHVPLDAVKKLLLERPKVKGIAVPGMPLGSPGMEVPGGHTESFKVYAFDGAGKIRTFG